MKKQYLKYLTLLIAIFSYALANAAVCGSAPYTEDFGTGSINSCHSISATSGGPWDFNGISWKTSTGCTVPADHTAGGGGDYMSMDHSSGDVGVIFQMGDIDVTGINPFLEFYHYMCSNSPNPTYVEAWDGSSWNVVANVIVGTGSWQYYGYDVSAYVFGANLLRIRFRAESNGNQSADYFSDVAIDDISVIAGATCASTSDLSATGVTASEANLAWTDPNGASSFQISHGTPSFTAGSGTQTIVGTNSYTLTGLSATTTYDWYVRAICAVGDTSAWSAVNSFTTTLADLTCPPLTGTSANFFSTSFESDACTGASNFNNFLGWSSANGNYGSWRIECSGATASSWINAGSYDGSDYVYFESSYATTTYRTSDTIVTTDFDISSLTGSARATGYYVNAGSSTFMVERSIDAGATWTNVLTNVGPGGASADDNGPWTLFIDDFSAEIGIASTVTWRFIGVSSGATGSNNLGDIGFDLFEIEACQTCIKPTALGVGAITGSTAVVNWTSAETDFDVAFGEVPFTNPGTPNGGYDNVANGVTLMGLSSNSDYEYYVRADCDAGAGTDESLWVGPFAFSTPCPIYSAPFNENFDASLNTPACWDNTFGSEPWSFLASGAGNPYTPLSGSNDHTSGSGNYAWIDASSNIGTNAFITPDIDISSLGAAEVGYWILSNNTTNSNQNSIELSYWDGAAWVVLNTYSANDANWVEVKEIVPGSAPGITKFKLEQAGSEYRNDLLVDDFFVQEAPTCLVPSNLGVGTITATTAVVNWTSSESTFDVGFGIAPFAEPTSPNAGFDNVANGVTLTGLSDLSTYQYWVRADCDAAAGTDESLWVGPFDFTTDISPLSCSPGTGTVAEFYTTSFETSGCSSSSNWDGYLGWSQESSNTSGSWRIECSGTTASGWIDAGPHDGSSYAFFESTSATGTNVSDTLTTTNYDISNLTGSARATGYYLNGGTSTFIVERSVDAGVTWTSVMSNIGLSQGKDPDMGTWTLFGDDFSSVIGSASTITWRFIGVSDGTSDAGDIGFDLFEIEACQTCIKPTTLGVGATTATSAVVNWNSSDSNFDVAFGLAPFTNPGTPNAGYDDIANGVTLTGLSAASNYQYYVRTDCDAAAGTDESYWVGPFAFSTPCATYVAPYTQNFDGLTVAFPYTDLPTCWEDQSSQQEYWKVTDDNLNNPLYLPNYGDHTSGSGNYMWIDASTSFSVNIAENEMVTPDIDISGLTTPYVGFWFASNLAGSNHHTISLDAWDGSGWVNVTSLSGSFAGWVEIASELPSGIPSVTKFRIEAINNSSAGTSNDLGVDDFFVIEKPLNTWTGSTDTDWHNDLNWSFGLEPTSAEEVVIPDVSLASGNFPIALAITVGKITVEANASLTINIGVVLEDVFTNNGTVTLADGAYLDDFSTGTGSYVGDITVETVAANGVSTDQRLISSAVSTPNVSELADDLVGPWGVGLPGTNGLAVTVDNCATPTLTSTSNYGNLFEFNESLVNTCALDGWVVRSSGELEDAKGYSAYLANGSTFDLSGTPNTGAISVPVTKGTSNVTDGEGWNLIGNPYPSPISRDAVVLAGGANASYFVTTGVYQGSYTAYGIGSNIAIGQGFQVEVAATGTVDFTDAMRNTNAATWYENENWFTHKLEVSVHGNQYADKTTLYYNNEATNGYEAMYDVTKRKSNVGHPTLSTTNANKELVLNGLSVNDLGETVPMSLYSGANGNFRLSFEGLETFPTNTTIYVKDLLLDVVHNIATGDYNFEASTLDAADRFELIFIPEFKFEASSVDCDLNNASITTLDDNNVLTNRTFELSIDGIVEQVGNLSEISSIELEAGSYNLEVLDMFGGAQLYNFDVNSKETIEASMDISSHNVLVDEIVSLNNVTTNATNIQWSIADIASLYNVNNASYSFETAGSYEITLYVTNEDCIDSKTETVIVSNKSTGIIDFDETGSIKIYSYANTIVTEFDNSTTGEATINLYNLLGQKVYTQEVSTSVKETITLNRIESGNYIVQVVMNNEVYSIKLYLTK